MKNKYVLFITVLFLSFSKLEAQFVTIPDANFKAYLQSNYSACFNGGGQLDTTCTAVLNATTMSPRNLSIADLTGVQYFKGLQTLQCSNNQLSTLAPLPNSLRYLYCDTNQFSVFPNLNLPNLFTVTISNNQLTTIGSIPSSITTLWCRNNQLTNITASATLLTLVCDHNQLTSINSYPSLHSLVCDHNLLTTLPTLSNNLWLLYCSNNQLTSLPAMPSTLFRLKCSSNQLTSLPSIVTSPDFDTLDCSSNLLDCLPTLPSTMRSLHATGNNIACLPNVPSYPSITFTSDIGEVVCTSTNNPNGCVLTGLIKGNVNDSQLQLFPNPTKGILEINTDLQNMNMVFIKILSLDGREVYSTETSNLDYLNIDLSAENKGIYYVQIIMDENVICRKLILE